MTLPAPQDGTGNLPPGVHDAPLDEIRDRFATNRRRREIFQGLEYVLTELAARGCRVAWIDGSFVTSKLRPRDVDVVFKPPITYGPHWGILYHTQRDDLRNRHLVDLLTSDFSGEITPGLPNTSVIRYFQEDRDGRAKGIIRIKLSTGSQQ